MDFDRVTIARDSLVESPLETPMESPLGDGERWSGLTE